LLHYHLQKSLLKHKFHKILSYVMSRLVPNIKLDKFDVSDPHNACVTGARGEKGMRL
jgi:hypothetical protein